MAIIVPTLLSKTIDEHTVYVNHLLTFVKKIHLDISDGEFAPGNALMPSELTIPSDLSVDIHAMVKKPSKFITDLARMKPRLVILHAEADEDLTPMFDYLHQLNIRTGVALLPSTHPSKVERYIKKVNHVLIFAGSLGSNGGKPQMLQLQKIPLIKEINPNVEISWDGGVSMQNALQISNSEVDILYAGSAIKNAQDPKTAYDQLSAEVARNSVI